MPVLFTSGELSDPVLFDTVVQHWLLAIDCDRIVVGLSFESPPICTFYYSFFLLGAFVEFFFSTFRPSPSLHPGMVFASTNLERKPLCLPWVSASEYHLQTKTWAGPKCREKELYRYT